MRKIVRALLFVALVAGLVVSSGVGSPAPAQDKKGDSKKDAKVGQEKEARAGQVEIYKDKAGDYRFRIKDADGKVVAMPPKGFETKEECHKVLDLIKTTLNTMKPVEIKDEKK